MCIKALGKKVTEDEVNDVLGATPMHGASWEQALAAAQYFGCRGTLVVPATLNMVKKWTDAGIPVMIAWNPEGRPWSHASVVFDVDDNGNVHVADPNIPDPELTVRVVSKDEFYHKWMEKVSDSLIVRRPAMAIELEVTSDGHQVVASKFFMPAYAEKIFDQKMKRIPGTFSWVSQEKSFAVTAFPPNRSFPGRYWVETFVPSMTGDHYDEKTNTIGIGPAWMHDGRSYPSLEGEGFKDVLHSLGYAKTLAQEADHYADWLEREFPIKVSAQVRAKITSLMKGLATRKWEWGKNPFKAPQFRISLDDGTAKLKRAYLESQIAKRWLRKVARASVHGIAVYKGKIDPQTGNPFLSLLNSANPKDVGSIWVMPEEALLKIRKDVPFLVEYDPDDDFLNYVPLTKV